MVLVSWMAGHQSVACAICSVRVSKPAWWTLQNARCPLTCNPFHFPSLPAKTLRKPVKPSLFSHKVLSPATSGSKREIYSWQVRTGACRNILAKFYRWSFRPIFNLSLVYSSPISANQESDCKRTERWYRCFEYAIASALHPIQPGNHPTQPEKYIQYFEQDGLNDIEYPVNPVDIPQLEERLNISINIFSYFDDIGKALHPMYISRQNYPIHIGMLYFKQHYAWIKDFSRLFSDVTAHNGDKFFSSVALDNLDLKVHSSVISSCAPARITSPRFTSFRSLKGLLSLLTGSTLLGLRSTFTQTLSQSYYKSTSVKDSLTSIRTTNLAPL